MTDRKRNVQGVTLAAAREGLALTDAP